MATSETEIANIAMLHLGEDPISNIDSDVSARAIAARRRFDTTRDAVLAMGKWSFAKTQASIAADPEAPAWGFSFRYTLPGDFIRFVEPEQLDEPFRRRGRYIHTDHGSPFTFDYIYRNEAVGEWEPMFTEAVGALLAANICIKLGGNVTLKRELEGLAASKAREARSIDAQGEPLEELEIDVWLYSRY